MNPILVKEFRQRWRTMKTPVIISLYLLTLGGFVFFVLFQQELSQGYIQIGDGKLIFMILSMVQMGLIAFVAPGLTAGSISGEREKQTLNLLLTTHLSPTSIIISKLLSSIAFVFLLIVSTMPFYAVAVLYGGVSPLNIIETIGLLILMVLLCGSFGVLCSAWFKKTTVSTIVTYGVLFVFFAAPPFLMELFQDWFWSGVRFPNHPFLNNNEFFNSLPLIFQGISLPVMLISLFEPSILPENTRTGDLNIDLWNLDPWLLLLTVIPILIGLFIGLSIYLLHPVRPKLKWEFWRFYHAKK